MIKVVVNSGYIIIGVLLLYGGYIMRESKMRNVDFTLDELADMAKLTRKQFTDRLSRVCELYNIDKGDFKAYPDEEDSIY